MASIDLVLLHRITAKILTMGSADLIGNIDDALHLLAHRVRRNKG
jgi:hypothetical protein